MEEKTEMSAERVVRTLVEIAKEIQKREHAREVFLRSTHGRFNIFTTLLDAHDEVRLHTRFLAHLLNPQGEHDCEGLFLGLFLEVVGLSGDLSANKCRLVKAEHYTGGLGNIDIYMEFETASVVVENKIFAGDQDRQLARYAEYANKRHVPCHIFYLTLDGHDPSEQSLADLSADNVKCISYRDDILPWLERCLQNTYEFVNINQTLQQYKMTVRQLLRITLEGMDMDDIKEMIKNNREIIKCSEQIQQALHEIEAECINRFWADLLAELRKSAMGFRVARKWGNTECPAFATKGNPAIELTQNVIVEYRPVEKELFVGAYPGQGRTQKTCTPELLAKYEKVKSIQADVEIEEWWGCVCWLLSENRCFSNKAFLIEMMDDDKRGVEIMRCLTRIEQFVVVVEDSL